ncbi:hypothetical protein DICSQDRAFT_126967 [Dichomitus squalens LYAD-421 SS1]|uniref:DUF6534 domain-containing protein n=1 Tax=Dichomitus squalens (strain LYAD-421) TaxID=732165 RepID=R7SZZ0_DICSQ|nr:uncharacterized protein DICSQDRAFT_126967 [Dichomitus squalens LYAD-421 SS1]EJF61533.1 hypothetical protein DICSQDRAFT_126967 [Dichomitus squalens LYAD-421 SS1]
MASPIENLYGALLLGTFFSLIYFRVYPNDEVNIRVLVWCALVLTNISRTKALPITAELSIILSLVALEYSGDLASGLYRILRSHSSSRSLMENFMLYVLNTGLLVSICDIVSWILAYAVARTAWWIAFDTATTKLYLITFLSVLNSRDMAITRGIEIFGSDATYGLNAIERAARQARAERYNAPQIPDIGPTKIDIKVATEIEGENQTTRDMMADDSDAHKPGQVFRL